MPSQTTDEITGQMSLTASKVRRVTSARSLVVSENTSPVWPLVISALMPGRFASQVANRRSSASSMLKSGRNGTAVAGMMPWRSMRWLITSPSGSRSGFCEMVRGAAGGFEGARQRRRGGEQRRDADLFEVHDRGSHGRRRDADGGDRIAVGVEHRRRQHAKAGDVLLIGHRVAAGANLLEPRQQLVEIDDRPL